MSEEPPVSVTPDDIHAHPRKTGHSRIDLILALTAIFISAVSLYVAIEHGHTERQLVAANSWPFLEKSLSNGGTDGNVIVAVENGGVGPAKLKTFEVSYRGASLTSWIDWLQRCCGLPKDRAGEAAAIPDGFSFGLADEVVIRPGDSVAVLTLPRRATDPTLFKHAGQSVLGLKFRACYCSILDECWISDLSSTRTQPVTSCPGTAHRFDPNGR